MLKKTVQFVCTIFTLRQLSTIKLAIWYMSIFLSKLFEEFQKNFLLFCEKYLKYHDFT